MRAAFRRAKFPDPMSEPDNSRAKRSAFWRKLAHGPRLAGQGLVRIYRYTLSPLIGYDCRHLPTCSHYSEEAIGRFGLWAGGWMTLARLCRCHPWGTSGLDFVPQSKPARAHWFLPWRYGRWRGTNDTPPNPTPADQR
jgi:putative membrane protein insertion efficiency factor